MHESPMPKATVLVWTDINAVQMKQLDELTEAETIHKFFIKTFQLEPNTKRTTVLCDLFYYAVVFARNNHFNSEQTSTFISILKRVHQACTRTPFANMEETYQYFKVLVLKHSLSRPPHSLRIFTPDLTKKVTDYVVDTYFRHYKMYKYIFTPTIDFHLTFTFEGMTRDQATKDEANETATTSDHAEKGAELNTEVAEVLRLIYGFLQDELRKVQPSTHPTTEKAEAPHLATEKQRPVKSSSSKTSKSRTPK